MDGADGAPGRVTAIVWTVIVASFVFPLMFSMVGVILPPMGRDLDASGISLGMVESLFLATSAALVLPMGRLSDATDKNSIFTYGLLLYAVTTLLMGTMPTIEWVLFMRVLQGLASSLYAASGMAILSDLLPPERRGRAFGLVLGSVYAGLAVGPLMGGFITEWLGWRWVFFLSGLPMAACFLAGWLFLDRRWRAPVNPIDLRGSALVFCGIMGLVLGSAMIGKHESGWLLFLGGLILCLVFLTVEDRATHPLLGLGRIRRNVDLGGALLAQATLYFAAAGGMFLISMHLQVVMGYTPPMAGLLLTASPVLMAMIAPISGRLVEHLSAQSISMAGIVMVALSAGLATFIDSATGISWILMVVIVQGVGFALFSSPNMTIIMNSVDPHEASLASALSAMTRTLGMVFGMVVVTTTMSLTMGTGTVAEYQPEFGLAMRISYSAFTLVCLISARFGFRRLTLKGS